MNNCFIHLLGAAFQLQQVFIRLMSIKEEHATVQEERDLIKKAYSCNYIHNTWTDISQIIHNVSIVGAGPL